MKVNNIMEKKYELVDVNDPNGHFRIRALRSFGNVKVGDLGGFVQSEDNLSHEGNCWIYDDARVYENAIVYENAQVYRNARVYGNAIVYENAQVYGTTLVYENAQVYGDAQVYGAAILSEKHHVQFSRCTSDLKNDLITSILVQCDLLVIDKKITCFKNVRRDLSSFHDPSFKYKVGEFASVENPDISNRSCASGLHVSRLTYWDHERSDFARLVCEVDLKDVITVQEGKMRVKRLFVKAVI